MFLSWHRAKPLLIVYVLSAAAYLSVAGERLVQPSPYNHFTRLADSWLHGQLDARGGRPPHLEDWACFDAGHRGACPPDAFWRPQPGHRWYVSFPPFPAVLLVPAVAMFGPHVSAWLVWALLAGLGPAFVFLFLRRLRDENLSGHTPQAEWWLTALFALGSMYFVSAVQGTVWYAAHVVAATLIAIYAWASIGARRPLIAGAALACSLATRPSTVLLGLFFFFEVLRATSTCVGDGVEAWWKGTWPQIDWRRALRRFVVFALPIAIVGTLLAWHNYERFGNIFEFGHRYLHVKWRPRIERWGLFHYHYLSRNLAVMWASLPWVTDAAPHIRISRHGLALWFAMPPVLYALWPRHWTPVMKHMAVAAGCVAVMDLLYQNSGWVQFSYRFALDYMVFVIALIAMSGRRFGAFFKTLCIWSIAVHLLGAITFNRAPRFYDDDPTQQRIFQPDLGD